MSNIFHNQLDHNLMTCENLSAELTSQFAGYFSIEIIYRFCKIIQRAQTLKDAINRNQNYRDN